MQYERATIILVSFIIKAIGNHQNCRAPIDISMSKCMCTVLHEITTGISVKLGIII